jgi:hypothetical protein
LKLKTASPSVFSDIDQFSTTADSLFNPSAAIGCFHREPLIQVIIESQFDSMK